MYIGFPSEFEEKKEKTIIKHIELFNLKLKKEYPELVEQNDGLYSDLYTRKLCETNVNLIALMRSLIVFKYFCNSNKIKNYIKKLANDLSIFIEDDNDFIDFINEATEAAFEN